MWTAEKISFWGLFFFKEMIHQLLHPYLGNSIHQPHAFKVAVGIQRSIFLIKEKIERFSLVSF